ncbi:HPr-rel-A system PqqD family peptide chaperone [Sphingorhabdus arenilitoris]|uniref:HPr-rel-A system PqqD family peptide chaperone n=1 Tax=Sphingorhabdus arenilitoris TaxID=1490041 RepID=A0ABV8RHB0_9SPHN
MTGPTPLDQKYRAEKSEDIIIHPLDVMTLIYQRRSGITHIVADPVPQILEAMAGEAMTASELMAKLSGSFDMDGGDDVQIILSERLEELASLGLVEPVHAP